MFNAMFQNAGKVQFSGLQFSALQLTGYGLLELFMVTRLSPMYTMFDNNNNTIFAPARDMVSEWAFGIAVSQRKLNLTAIVLYLHITRRGNRSLCQGLNPLPQIAEQLFCKLSYQCRVCGYLWCGYLPIRLWNAVDVLELPKHGTL